MKMPERRSPYRWLCFALALCGVLVCAWLEYVHVRAYLMPTAASFCALGERLDCDAVALSRHAVFAGLPLPLWGAVGFLAMALAALRRSGWLLWLSGFSALAGVALTAVSALQVGALCLLCEAAHVISVALFACALRARRELVSPLRSFDESALVLLPSLGLLGAAALFVPAYWSVSAFRDELPFAEGHTESGHPWLGAESPRLVLEEFVDYSCPHCRAASARSAMRLAAHPRELRVVRRFFPRTRCQPVDETRCIGTRIAICADEQGRFWQADRWLFEHSDDGRVPSVDDAARDLGMDREALAACVARPSTMERADSERRAAKKLRVPGTPYYAVDGRLLTAAAAAELVDEL